MQAVTDPARHSHRHQLVGDSYDIRASVDPEQLARAIVDQLFRTRGTLPEHATRNDWYLALAQVVRDRLLDRWVATARTLMQKDVRVVSYLSAEFLVGPHLANNVINLGIERQIREATRLSSAWISNSWLRRRKSRASATAASAAWPPASSIPWRRWRFRRSATASATSSASSIRGSSTAGRSRRPTSGCAAAIPGRSRGPRCAYPVGFGGQHRGATDDERPATASAGSRAQVVNGHPVRHADRSAIACQHDEHAAAVEGRGDRVVRLLRVQRRRLLRRGRRRRSRPRTSPRCSIRTTSRSQGKQLRLEQQYFFVSLLAAGHDPHAPASRADPLATLPREVRRRS